MAIDALVSWSARVGGDRWQPLAVALAGERWARRVRSNYRSWRWWKRLECARQLSVAGLPTDTKRLLGLLADQHPAVHIAAVASLEWLESAPLITAALEGLRTSPPTVQGYYAGMRRPGRPPVVPSVLTQPAASHTT